MTDTQLAAWNKWRDGCPVCQAPLTAKARVEHHPYARFLPAHFLCQTTLVPGEKPLPGPGCFTYDEPKLPSHLDIQHCSEGVANYTVTVQADSVLTAFLDATFGDEPISQADGVLVWKLIHRRAFRLYRKARQLGFKTNLKYK